MGSALCTALSGLQSVMVTSWLQPFLLLQFQHHIYHIVVIGDQSSGKRTRTSSSSSSWGRLLLLFLLTLLVQSLGFTVAFGGMFNDPSFTLPGVLTVLFVSTIAWLVLCIPFLASLVYRRRYAGATLSQPLVFASIWTALWHLAASKAPIGSVGNPAYSQASVKPLVLTASVWGVDGIVFLLAWAASIAHEGVVLADSEMGGGSETRHFVEGCACSSQDHTPDGYERINGPSRALNRYLKKNVRQKAATAHRDHALHTKIFIWVFFLSLVYTGCREVLLSGAFFERGIAETLNPTVAASCILRQAAGDAEVDSLWNETQSRVDAGDALIIWSEAATVVQGDEAESALLLKAAQIAREGRKSKQAASNLDVSPENDLMHAGPYLGLSYIKFFSPWAALGAANNVFALILPDGSVGFKYIKSHPVPFVETNLVAGSGEIQVVDTALGRIGAAICFDLEFPDLIRQAGKLGVDIMVQPSWTWGPVGPLEFDTDAFRAVENGFTLLRCSSVGVSGVVSPFYRVLEYREALTNTVLSMRVPIAGKVWSFYPGAGFLFGHAITIMALVYSLITWLPLLWVQNILYFLPDVYCRFFIGQTIQEMECQNGSPKIANDDGSDSNTASPHLQQSGFNNDDRGM